MVLQVTVFRCVYVMMLQSTMFMFRCVYVLMLQVTVFRCVCNDVTGDSVNV